MRGFRIVRFLWILPKQLRGAAGPNPGLGGDHDDDEHATELVPLPPVTAVKHSDLINISLLLFKKFKVPQSSSRTIRVYRYGG